MNCSTPHLDRDYGIQEADRCLKGRKVVVLVRKYTEVTGFDTETDPGRKILLGWLEPSITLSLSGKEFMSRRRYKKSIRTCLNI